jgi:hypothetical protein
MDLATVGLGPDKAASFKPLCEKPDSVLGCPKDLHQIAKPHDIQHTDRKSL